MRRRSPSLDFATFNARVTGPKIHLGRVVLAVLLLLGKTGLSVAAPGGGFLLVAKKADQALGIIDPKAGWQIATIAENGITGHEVAASPDGKWTFVPI